MCSQLYSQCMNDNQPQGKHKPHQDSQQPSSPQLIARLPSCQPPILGRRHQQLQHGIMPATLMYWYITSVIIYPLLGVVLSIFVVARHNGRSYVWGGFDSDNLRLICWNNFYRCVNFRHVVHALQAPWVEASNQGESTNMDVVPNLVWNRHSVRWGNLGEDLEYRHQHLEPIRQDRWTVCTIVHFHLRKLLLQLFSVLLGVVIPCTDPFDHCSSKQMISVANG